MDESLTFLQSGFTPRCSAAVIGFYHIYSIALLTDKSLSIEYDDAYYELEGQWIWPVYPGPWIRLTRLHGAPWWEHRFVNFQKPLVHRWITAGIWLTQPQAVPSGRD